VTPDQDPSADPRFRRSVATIFALALLLRVAHVLTLRSSPFFDSLFLDLALYDEWGARIATGALLGEAPFFQDPLYAYVLGAVYAVLGHEHLPVLLIQALSGAAVGPMLAVAARRHLGPSVALVAGALAAVYLPSIYYDGLILKTSLSVFLVALLLLLLSRAGDHGATWWIVVGAVLGAACLNRGNLLLAAPLLAVWILARGAGHGSDGTGRSGPPWGAARRKELVAFGAGLLLLLLPAALHNRLAGGEWILTTANAGQNLFIGNNPLNVDGEYQALPFVDSNPRHEQADFAAEAARRSGAPLGPRRTSRFWRDEALRWMREHPGDLTVLTWRKLQVFWSAYEVPDNLDYYLYREYAPLLRLPVPGFGLVAPLGLLGALLALSRPGWPRLLAVFVAVYSTSVVAFFVLARFRMPMMPAIHVLAALAAVEIVRSVRAWLGGRAAPTRAVALSLALIALCAWVNLPVRGPRDGYAVRIARALDLPHRAETTALAHYNLGLVHARRAEAAKRAGGARASERTRLWYGRAEEELLLAIELEPERPQFHVELGKVLAQQHRDAEAIERYRIARELAPGDYRIAHSLGLLYRRVGDLDSAAAAFRRSLALAPRHAAGAVQLGEVLLEQGRAADAAQAFRHALRLNPDDARAGAGLARAEGRPGDDG
jgi:tetratricopeptide (TPR) repeat protein